MRLILLFARRDLRSGWRQWIGALVVLAVAGMALTCASVVAGTGSGLPPHARYPLNQSLGSLAATNAAVVALVGFVMIRNVVDQLIAQRRRTMATWMLAGLTPRQVTAVLTLQGTVLALVAAVTGAPVGVAAARAAFVGLAAIADAPAPEVDISLRALLVPMGLLIAVTVLALRRPTRRASLVDPAVGMRDDVDVEAQRLSPWRLLPAVIAAIAAGYGVAVAERVASAAAAGGAVLGVMAAVALGLSALGPKLAVWIHRVWSALVPRSLVSWRLARSSVMHSPQRITSVAVPVALVALLPSGMQMLSSSMRESEIASIGTAKQAGDTLTFLLMTCLLPALVALVGASMALFMASQRRDGELATSALVGATTSTQLGQVAIEALSGVITGALLGASGLAVVGWALACLLTPLFSIKVLVWPLSVFGVSVALAAATCLIASLAPTLGMVRRPPHRIQLSLSE